MDLDDVVKALLPKSARKKAKKKLKKLSLGGLLVKIIKRIAALFSGRNTSSAGSQHVPKTAVGQPRQTRPYTSDPLSDGLAQAHVYRQKIAVMARNAPPDSLAETRLTLLSDRVNEWVHMIEEIVKRAQTHHEDGLLAEEHKRVPKAIKRLEKQLAEAKDPALRNKLERTLDNRRKQLAQLEQVQNRRQIAELKVENTLAQLGIIYSQLHSGTYVAQQSSYDRLAVEINEEVHTLEDYLQTLSELQAST